MSMIEFHKFGLFFYLLRIVELCFFPESWSGKYIDSHETNPSKTGVLITRDEISNKGSCMRQHNEYYLLYDRKVNCYTCMAIVEKHDNALLYSQTKCISVQKFTTSSSLCLKISQRSRFDMLLRETTHVIRCPFQKVLKFTYTDQSCGYCATPISKLEPNADRTRFRLRFRHCVEFASLNKKNLDAACIAQWKEHHEDVVIIKLLTPNNLDLLGDGKLPLLNTGYSTPIDKSALEDYRCIKYIEQESGLIYISISSSWSCEGVHNSTDGPIVMELSEDFHGWPRACCSFPDWLTQHTWQDLTGSLYFVGNNPQTLEIYKVINETSNDWRIISIYRCIRQLDYFLLDEEYVLLTHSIHDWSPQLQCLKLRRKSSNVAFFSKGHIIEVGYHSKCLDDDEQYYINDLIIVDQQGSSTPCPEKRFYHTPPVDNCVHRVDMGCIFSSVAHFESLCSSHIPKIALLCVGSWVEKTTLILMLKDLSSADHFCFKLIKNSSILVTASRVDCTDRKSEGRVPYFLPRYNLIRNESCEDPMSDIYRSRILNWTSAYTHIHIFPLNIRQQKTNFANKFSREYSYIHRNSFVGSNKQMSSRPRRPTERNLQRRIVTSNTISNLSNYTDQSKREIFQEYSGSNYDLFFKFVVPASKKSSNNVKEVQQNLTIILPSVKRDIFLDELREFNKTASSKAYGSVDECGFYTVDTNPIEIPAKFITEDHEMRNETIMASFLLSISTPPESAFTISRVILFALLSSFIS